MRVVAAGIVCLGILGCTKTPALEVAAAKVIDAGPPPSPPPPPRPVPDPERFPSWGVDVSHHQDRIDWKKVAKDPRVKFAYVKATEGANYVDHRFRQNWNQARAAGLRVGAYHFFRFFRTGEAQANNFINVVPRAKHALPPVVDVELWDNCTANPNVGKVREALRAFIRRIERRYGTQAIIYAPPDAWALLIKDSGLTNPLWVPSVGIEPTRPEMRWSMWQFSVSERVEGIGTDVDMDVMASEAEVAVR